MPCFMKVNLLSFPIDTYSLKRIPLRIKSIGFLDGPPMYHPESLLTSNRDVPQGTGIRRGLADDEKQYEIQFESGAQKQFRCDG